MTRDEFRQAYRAARLLPRKFACMSEMKKVPAETLGPALQCWTKRHENLGGGVAYSRAAAKSGRSFKKAVGIYLRAVKWRRLNMRAA